MFLFRFGLGDFGSSRAGGLWDGGLRLFRASRLFSRGGICYNRLGLTGSRRLRRGGVSVFFTSGPILFLSSDILTFKNLLFVK